MKRGIKIALLVLIGVILIAAIIFLVWALTTRPEVIFRPSPGQTPQQEEPAGLPTTGTGTGGTVVEIPEEPEEPVINAGTSAEIERQQVINLSKTFAERFGSFSNQGNFANINDLMPIMTSSLRQWAEGYIEQKQAEITDREYYGISTRVLSVDIESIDLEGGTAEINLQTQRVESSQGEDRTYYQTLTTRLIKTGEEWLIDFVQWQ